MVIEESRKIRRKGKMIVKGSRKIGRKGRKEEER